MFGSQTKYDLSARVLVPPPLLSHELPLRPERGLKSIRELYIESFEPFEAMNFAEAVKSPFYTISSLFKLNCFCWNQIIEAIREEDFKIRGISNISVNHTEYIKRCLSIVERNGTLGWFGREEPLTRETKEALEEDFKHLVNETDLLWQIRDKLATIQKGRSEAKWKTLTNVFTYG